MIIYLILAAILVVVELLYFRIADKFNIIDKPNERSSHSAIVLRGGGILFLIGVWLWVVFFGINYVAFFVAISLASGISFIDDMHSLPDSIRLATHFIAMGLLIWQLFLIGGDSALLGESGLLVKILFVVGALFVCVGATNIYNFMDGINGITAAYSMAVLIPLFLMDRICPFMEESFIITVCLSVLVFGFFNFRNRGKARCFAGDVGSVGIAFILLFAIGMLIVKSGDVTWLVFLLVYGVDGCMTICHRILLHENLGEAHRKHAYQLMANELRIPHTVVSAIYFFIQLSVSLGFVFVCPILTDLSGMSLVAWHWIYLGVALLILVAAYVRFVKKYYYLHEQYLNSLK